MGAGSASTANTLAAGTATARVALTFSWSMVCALLVISSRDSRRRGRGPFPSCTPRCEAELTGRVGATRTRTTATQARSRCALIQPTRVTRWPGTACHPQGPQQGPDMHPTPSARSLTLQRQLAPAAPGPRTPTISSAAFCGANPRANAIAWH
jgi:hypothetical protein